MVLIHASHLCSYIVLRTHLNKYIHLTGDLKLVEKPSPLTLAPHDFANIKANVKVASTENGIIFGNIGETNIFASVDHCHSVYVFVCFERVSHLWGCSILSSQSTMCRELLVTETASSSATSTSTSWTTSSQHPAPMQNSDRCGQSLSGKTR